MLFAIPLALPAEGLFQTLSHTDGLFCLQASRLGEAFIRLLKVF